MMMTIEQLVATFNGLPAATNGLWSISALVNDRVYLSRDEAQRFAVFVLGEERSFGNYPRIAGIRHSSEVRGIPGDKPFAALQLRSGNVAQGNRIMAHIAYEFGQRMSSEPTVQNATLIAEVSWILELLADQDSIMSFDEQRGLVGELVLLRRLLSLATELEITASEVLGRWWGADRAKRDFSALGVAVEVKTTSKNAREHYIGSLSQLDPQEGEEVFLCSLGARIDPTAPRKLPAFVHDVQSLLRNRDGTPDHQASEKFTRALRAYGYDPAKQSLYEAGPGFMSFHLPPKLFREVDLDRVRLTSFKGDTLPTMVNEVMYLLQPHVEPLSPSEEREVLIRLLRSPASSA
jgi:hypothetical protein